MASSQRAACVQIALQISQGKPDEAIKAATDYLDVFQTDHLVWEQLAQLHVDSGHFEQAQFCLEEGLLHNPGNIVGMLQLADLLYAQGGLKLQAARGYYAKVVEMSAGDNLRSLYGVLACEAAIQQALKARSKPKHGEGALSANAELAYACQRQLQALQSKMAPELQSATDVALQAL